MKLVEAGDGPVQALQDIDRLLQGVGFPAKASSLVRRLLSTTAKPQRQSATHERSS